MKYTLFLLFAIATFSSCTKEGDALVTSPPPVLIPESSFVPVETDSFFTDTAYYDSIVYRKIRTTPGAMYSLTVLDAPDYYFSIRVFPDRNLSFPIMDAGYANTPFEGSFIANDTAVYVLIRGMSSWLNATGFGVIIHQVIHLSPELSEGSWQNPVLLPANTFHTRTVSSGGTSYYLVPGLLPSTNYHICVYSMTGDVDLHAHMDNTFSMQYSVTLNYTDASPVPEVFLIPSDASGNAYLTVRGGELNPNASTFRLLLFP